MPDSHTGPYLNSKIAFNDFLGLGIWASNACPATIATSSTQRAQFQNINLMFILNAFLFQKIYYAYVCSTARAEEILAGPFLLDPQIAFYLYIIGLTFLKFGSPIASFLSFGFMHIYCNANLLAEF